MRRDGEARVVHQPAIVDCRPGVGRALSYERPGSGQPLGRSIRFTYQANASSARHGVLKHQRRSGKRMNKVLAVIGVTIAFAAVGCGETGGGSTSDPNIATLQNMITSQGPAWATAFVAQGNTGVTDITVTAASCTSTGGGYTCNAWYTVSGGYAPGKWSDTIPAACDSAGACQTFAGGTPIKVGN